MIRCYISGPMTGLPLLNFPAFNEAAARLRDLGYDVVNPVDIVVGPDAQWAEFLRADIAQLVTCDAIAPLPNWWKSKGARLEMHIARELGMREIAVGVAATGVPA